MANLSDDSRGNQEEAKVKFKIAKTSRVTQRWYFRIVAGNGRLLAISQTYHNWSEAWKAADAVRKNASAAPIE